jgi:molecular chaperone GrpE
MEDKEEVRFQVADRRFWAQDASLLERAPAPERKYPSFVEELKSRTELAEQKLREKVRKLDDEAAAFRERLGREMERRGQRDRRQFLLGLLEIFDNLERALAAAEENCALKEGVQLNLELFLSKLKAEGVESIDLLNQIFDPHLAEAVSVVPVESRELDHCIVDIVQRGFRLGDQVIRPARVRVGRFVGNG